MEVWIHAIVAGFQRSGNGGWAIVIPHGLSSSFPSKRFLFCIDRHWKIILILLYHICYRYISFRQRQKEWPHTLSKLCHHIYQICYQFFVWDGLSKGSKYFSSNTLLRSNSFRHILVSWDTPRSDNFLSLLD